MRQRTISMAARTAGFLAVCSLVLVGCKSQKRKGDKSRTESADKSRPADKESELPGDSQSEFRSVEELQAMVDEIEIPDLPGGSDLLTIAYTSAGQGELFAGG